MAMFSWYRRALLVGASAALAISTAGLLGAQVNLTPTRAYAAGDLGTDPIPCPAVVIGATSGNGGTVVTSGSGQGVIVTGPGTVAASSTTNGNGTTVVTSGTNRGVAIAGNGSAAFSSSSSSSGGAAFSGTMPGGVSIPGVSIS